MHNFNVLEFTSFFLSFIGQIWGNLISSLVFSERGENATTDVSAAALKLCGANDCPENDIGNNTNLKKPELSQVSSKSVFSIIKYFSNNPSNCTTRQCWLIDQL